MRKGTLRLQNETPSSIERGRSRNTSFQQRYFDVEFGCAAGAFVPVATLVKLRMLVDAGAGPGVAAAGAAGVGLVLPKRPGKRPVTLVVL